ncbi:MAG: SDR family oxidoreductase [Syntrophobacteraceae bacterium]
MMRTATGIAVVTGAGSGIGRAVAVELSSRSITVIAVGRREDALRETAKLAQGRVCVVSADVGDPSEYRKILSEIDREGGKVRYVVHAAGVSIIEPLRRITPESWRRAMATNLDGRLFLTLHLLPRLEKGSRILFVGSNSATRPRKSSTSYCVSKAGSYMLQECLKMELSGEGILVTSAIPSPVHTALLEDQMAADPEVFPDALEYRREQREGRLISPWTVGRFYRWLLTEVPDDEYSARQWNIQDNSHHRFWLGNDDLFRP